MEDTSTIIETNDKSIIINNISGYTFQIIDNNLHLTPINEYLKEIESAPGLSFNYTPDLINF